MKLSFLFIMLMQAFSGQRGSSGSTCDTQCSCNASIAAIERQLQQEHQQLLQQLQLQRNDTQRLKSEQHELLQSMHKMLELQINTQRLAKRQIDYMFQPETCADVKMYDSESGVHTLKITDTSFVTAYCDHTTDGGGWTVFQRRQDGSVDFRRNWDEYVQGFGDPAGEFWLGLEAVHVMTYERPSEMRVDMESFGGRKKDEVFPNFNLTDASDGYRLRFAKRLDLEHVGRECTALYKVGYYLCASHEGMKFSTVDRDNDLTTGNCAEYRGGGGWWYTRCTDVNLNGIYFPDGVATPRENGIIWKNWVGYGSSLKFAQMMFRPMAKA